jgi:hypothetical protein
MSQLAEALAEKQPVEQEETVELKPAARAGDCLAVLELELELELVLVLVLELEDLASRIAPFALAQQ